MGTCWNYKACDGHCGQVKKSRQKFLSVFPLWVKLDYKALNRNGAQVQRVEGWGTVSQDRKRYRFKTRKALFRPTVFLSDSEQSCPAIWTAITGQRKLQCRGNLSKTKHCSLPKWFASKIFQKQNIICYLQKRFATSRRSFLLSLGTSGTTVHVTPVEDSELVDLGSEK